MAKGNKAVQKEVDLTIINRNFDIITRTLDDIANKSAPLMPLVSESLLFTKKLVKLYKEAFNAGLKNK